MSRTALLVTGTHKGVPFTLEATAYEVPPPIPSSQIPYYIANRHSFGGESSDPIPGTLRVYIQTLRAPDSDPGRGYRDGRQWFPDPVTLHGIPYRIRIELERAPFGSWQVVRSERPVECKRLAWYGAADGATVTFGDDEPTAAARRWAWEVAREVLPALLEERRAELVPLAVESLEIEAERRRTLAAELRAAADVIDEGARATIAATR